MGAIAEHASAVSLIDHHVHGFFAADAPGDPRATDTRFASALLEADTTPARSLDAGFDTQAGFAVRAHCAPLLGLERHCSPADYLRRRRELGEEGVARELLPAAGVSEWLVDSGFDAGLVGVDDLARVGGGVAHEVVRIEQVAEEAAAAPGAYADAFVEALTRRAAGAVALKSILAYRGGFGGDLSDPPSALVELAAQRWRDAGGVRLTDRILLRFGLHRALELGVPLQFHVGFGDRDADLATSNPLLLTDFLRGSGDTPIMLLHCYPFEREAGYLAQAFGNVFLDGGLAIHHLGARSGAFIARLFEMAPFSKLLYSSDGCGPAEFHHLGATLWRSGISRAVQGFVDAGEWSTADAIRVIDMIAHENARRVYRL
ncbi:amidohydrolase family protein [Williamsia sp. M5A3_1d]